MLMLHSGCTRVTRKELAHIPTPPANGRHKPVSHAHLTNVLISTAERRGLVLRKESYGVTHDGQKLYGALDFEVPPSYCMPVGITPSLGVRHSHDKTLAVALTCGTRVLVCDNGFLISELETSRRKHTSGLDIESLVENSIDEFLLSLPNFNDMHERMRANRLTDSRAKVLIHDLFMRQEVMAPKYLPAVSNMYFRDEKHRGLFPERDRWSLYNAVTECMKAQPISLQVGSFHALDKALCN